MKNFTFAASAGLASLVSFAASAEPLVKGQDFNCMIEPAQVVEVRSPVVGILEKVHVRRGQLIKRGQVLVSIESSVEQSAASTAQFKAQAQGAIELATNKAAAAREKARRMEELHREEFVSSQARDDAAAEMRLAESELKTATENSQLAKLEHHQAVDLLNRHVLKSPFNGVVVDQYLHPGALVDAGEGKKPILKIAQTQPLIVQAILPFRFFPQVHPGMRTTVSPEKPFGNDIAATVMTVDRVIDAAAGTFGIVAEISNERDQLPGGIRCRLNLRVTP